MGAWIGGLVIGLAVGLGVASRRVWRRSSFPAWTPVAAAAGGLLGLILLLEGVLGVRVETPPDTSYSGMRGSSSGVNALGEDVHLEEFEGKFLWLEYSAPWCQPCTPQSREISRLAGSTRSTVFLTVLTSGGEPFAPTSRALARSWAADFGLEPGHVIAGNQYGRVVPTHILYSPRGEVLFRHEGFLNVDRIREALSRALADWNRG